MNVDKVVKKLQEKYPGKNIVFNPVENPSEIVCEVDPEQGLAIAIIDRSQPHHHNKMIEEYKVLEGFLTLYVDGSEKELWENEEFTIYPGEVHFAAGEETWVEVKATPPWTPEDHIAEI